MLSGVEGPNKSARISRSKTTPGALCVMRMFNSLFIWIMASWGKKGRKLEEWLSFSPGAPEESVLVEEGMPNCPAGPNPGHSVLGDMWPVGIL